MKAIKSIPLFFFLFCACSLLRVNYDYDKNVDNQYKTYAFHKKE
jgi:hypothetical protein